MKNYSNKIPVRSKKRNILPHIEKNSTWVVAGSIIVQKRNGNLVSYNGSKIQNAVAKALTATKEIDERRIPMMCSIVEMMVREEIINKVLLKSRGPVPVELIQDLVENIMIRLSMPETVRSYILYRNQHKRVRDAKSALLDVKKTMEEYIGEEKDWRVKENSTVSLSLGGLILSNSGTLTANYWLSEIYDEEIANAHRSAAMHIHDLSMFSGYCAGWSLKQLLIDGLGGVEGRITSAPAKHLSTLCNQMVNFLGIMQNEWAGAQAFSSFDTYLAPFVRTDNLTYKQVKQCVQSFVYGVNTPSRWGCVPITTKIATHDGWKSCDELKIGDVIYTWVDGVLHEARLKHLIRHNNDYGVLHCYKGKGYQQIVTPEHRCIVESGASRGSYLIKQSMDIFKKRKDLRMPASFEDVDVTATTELLDDEVILAAMLYTDGRVEDDEISIYKSSRRDTGLVDEVLNRLCISYSKYEKHTPSGNIYYQYRIKACHYDTIRHLITSKTSIDEKFLHMSYEQSRLFVETWAQFDGSNNGRIMCQYDSEEIRSKLEIIMLRAGYMSHKWSRKKDKDKNPTNYIYADTKSSVVILEQEEIPYAGSVWCPNTDDGTAIYKDEDGNIFISGNCQAPFTNITLDWVVPEDMKNLPAIVGGKNMDFTYGDCKKEMDMINRAFIEIMIEGDANGRGFQYPIPTYSITKDFDWSDTENNRLLFEMAAKYGTPYFSNYINSDMEPSDVRSMCPLFGKEQVLVMNDYTQQFSISTVENLYNGNKKSNEYTILLNGEEKRARLNRFDGLSFLKVRTTNGHEVILSTNHANLVMKKDRSTTVVPTSALTTDDYLPFSIQPYEGEDMLTYEDGLLVGAFMGDGSLKDDYAVTFSLNHASKAELMAEIMRIGKQKFGARIATYDCENNCENVVLTSRMLRGLIETFVSGKATEKSLNASVINQSFNFRNGILDGLMATDGNRKSNCIYTASKQAVTDITAMLASMGIPTNIRTDDRTSTEGKFSDNPVYTIRMYRPKTGQPSYGDVYIKTEDYMWFRIESIEPISSTSSIGYCFEVCDDDTPYFMLPSGLVTHNCRLRLDLRELRKKSGGFFGSGESTGSVGVVTLNLPRLAYLAENEKEFYDSLDYLMDVAARSLDTKRKVITKMMDEGLYPYTKKYLGGFDNHFSTIGLVGMNEAVRNAKWLRTNLTTPEGQQFAKDVLNHMRERLSDYQEQYGALFNLEATPAESTSFRLAKHDVEKYPDIITAAEKGETPFYTNSSHLPVGYTDDVFDALDLQDDLQTLYTSGTVFHAFLGERLPDWKAAATLVREIAENYKLPYYTLSPTYSVCPEHGYIAGEHEKCPKCGKGTEVYSRITGYYRPLKNWNDGKVQEFKKRKEYDVSSVFEGNTQNVTPEKSSEEGLLNSNVVNGASCANGYCSNPTTAPAKEEASEFTSDVPMLVTTSTCPNCKMVKAFLDKAGKKYLVVDVTEYPEIAAKYDIKAVPTLIVPTKDGAQIIAGMSNIRGWIEN